eukprot:Rmarinus@m.14440
MELIENKSHNSPERPRVIPTFLLPIKSVLKIMKWSCIVGGTLAAILNALSAGFLSTYEIATPFFVAAGYGLFFSFSGVYVAGRGEVPALVLFFLVNMFAMGSLNVAVLSSELLVQLKCQLRQSVFQGCAWLPEEASSYESSQAPPDQYNYCLYANMQSGNCEESVLDGTDCLAPPTEVCTDPDGRYNSITVICTFSTLFLFLPTPLSLLAAFLIEREGLQQHHSIAPIEREVLFPGRSHMAVGLRTRDAPYGRERRGSMPPNIPG